MDMENAISKLERILSAVKRSGKDPISGEVIYKYPNYDDVDTSLEIELEECIVKLESLQISLKQEISSLKKAVEAAQKEAKEAKEAKEKAASEERKVDYLLDKAKATVEGRLGSTHVRLATGSVRVDLDTSYYPIEPAMYIEPAHGSTDSADDAKDLPIP